MADKPRPRKGELDKAVKAALARVEQIDSVTKQRLTAIAAQYNRRGRQLSGRVRPADFEFFGSPSRGSSYGSTRRLANYRLELVREEQRFQQEITRVIYTAGLQQSQQLRFANTTFIGETVLQMIPAAIAEMGVALEEFAANTQRQINRRIGLSKLHREVAVGAQKATIRSYQRRVQKRKHISYRSGEGRLPGRMLAALQSPEFVQHSQDGIQFGSQPLLDRVAAHWYRLNYGTAPAVQRPAPNFPLRTREGPVGGQLADRNGPSGAFALPPGIWIDLRTGKVQSRKQLGSTTPKGSPVEGFFPLGAMPGKVRVAVKSRYGGDRGIVSKNEERMTSGITGYRFFDAGIDYIARTLPQKYIDKSIEWFTEAALATKGNVTPYRIT